MMEFYIGSHLSIGNGYSGVLKKAQELDINVVQIFTKNARSWAEKEISREDTGIFAKFPVFSHAIYLINIASTDPQIRKKSVEALTNELLRSQKLGIKYVVLHPGSSRNEKKKKGMEMIITSLQEIKEKVGEPAEILLESTAGAGNTIGNELSDLSWIKNNSDYKKISFCLDTCHLFASGWNLKDKKECNKLLEEINVYLGIENVKLIHINDSIGDCGSNLDRHTHIGEGKIGLEGFKNFFSLSPFLSKPLVLETPKDKEDKWDRKNLSVLRNIIKQLH